MRPTSALLPAGLLSLAPLSFGQAESWTVSPETGRYEIGDLATGLRLGGAIPDKVGNVKTRSGRDKIGEYRQISFDWVAQTRLRSTIRKYEAKPVYWFRLEYLEKAAKAVPFPRFTSIPKGLHPFSYRDTTFAPASFGLSETSTPWLFFDKARSFIFSPASQFMVAKMVGDGTTSIGEALNDRLTEVPKGLQQDSFLVFGSGIGDTWRTWGREFRALYRRGPTLPDKVVDLFGYWTDNGADYYYNYDPGKGYAGTILALRKRYQEERIPLGYMQLDSWWYRKLYDSISGERSPEIKNAKFPAQDWNRYGGVLEYRASPDLFPNGLPAFQRALDLPFVVHGRWIDLESPLRKQYEISGVAPVDPKYWRETADYLASCGVICYEQDWLDHIYDHSPALFSQVGVADAFADEMAISMARKGMTLQYCMPTPRFILNGVRYRNLTNIRTASDRFEPGKWAQFIFGAPLVEGIGAVPWCDVFKSRETGNFILSVLSAGPVGTGDAIGREDSANILKATRPDGVIVKPDAPLTPTDETYFHESAHDGEPFVASTWTGAPDLRTTYFFAFPRSKEKRTATLELGTMPVYLVNLLTRDAKLSHGSVEVPISAEGFAYLMAVPLGKSGISLLGDLGKFVPTGKQRFAAISETNRQLRLTVAFAGGEGPVKVDAICDQEPEVSARNGAVIDRRFDPSTHRLSFQVVAGPKGTADIVLRTR